MSEMFADATCSTGVTSDGDIARCFKNLKSGSHITRSAGNTGSYSANFWNSMSAYLIKGSTSSEAGFVPIPLAASQTWIILFNIYTAPGGDRYLFGNADTSLTNTSGLFINALCKWEYNGEE